MDDLKKLHMQINESIDQRNKKILQIERAKTSDNQFSAYRRLFLNEFGKHGLKADIENLFLEFFLALMENEPEDDAQQAPVE